MDSVDFVFAAAVDVRRDILVTDITEETIINTLHDKMKLGKDAIQDKLKFYPYTDES